MELSPEMEARAKAAIEAGYVRDADELVEAALSLFEEREAWVERNREALAAMIKEGLETPTEEMTDGFWERVRKEVFSDPESKQVG